MRKLLLILTLSLTGAALTASPAAAAVANISCFPSDCSSWNLEGAWADGTVLESRAFLQHDSATGKVRSKTDWRVRKGGTPISGTDWDLDANDDGRGLVMDIYYGAGGVYLGTASGWADVFNTSIITRYSNWTCWGSSGNKSYTGQGYDIRATPPGLPRSGYKHAYTSTYDAFLNC